MNRAALDAESYKNYREASDFSIYITGEDVKEYIPNIPDKYIGRIAIFDGEMVLVSDGTSEEEKRAADTVGIKIMEETDYNYMLEMKYLEMAVLNHKDDLAKIGTPLGTTSNPYETIAGINYGLVWYKISTQDELTSLGLTTEQLGYMLHSPYIVKYSTGAVQSIQGKLMYAGTDNPIWKYTFNYKGEENGLVINNLVSAVIKDSNKTNTAWGNFTNYGSEGFLYENDEYGNSALKLDGNDIANMAVNQNIEINKCYSVNITIKGDTENQFVESVGGWNWPDGNSSKFGGTILAMSDEQLKYVLYVGILENKLRILNYRGHVGSGKKEDGVNYIENISAYDEKYMNIQITAERGGLTKVYINGSLKLSFNSGKSSYSYNNLSIGDLRTGRGLKYIGNVYNFALYGDILTDEEIAQNWNYIKNELGINEAGEKVN